MKTEKISANICMRGVQEVVEFNHKTNFNKCSKFSTSKSMAAKVSTGQCLSPLGVFSLVGN